MGFQFGLSRCSSCCSPPPPPPSPLAAVQLLPTPWTRIRQWDARFQVGFGKTTQVRNKPRQPHCRCVRDGERAQLGTKRCLNHNTEMAGPPGACMATSVINAGTPASAVDSTIIIWGGAFGPQALHVSVRLCVPQRTGRRACLLGGVEGRRVFLSALLSTA